MPDGRPALTGAERKRRHDRRVRRGLLYARGDLPPEIDEWLIGHGFVADAESKYPDDWGAAMVAERNTFAERVVKDMKEGS